MLRDQSLVKKRVYLSGPMVFDVHCNDLFAEMKKICLKHDLEGFSPLDNQTGLQHLPRGREKTRKIVQADFDAMDFLDGGIFCLNPFRDSTEMDTGTAVELGYMRALKKPLAGWTVDGRNYFQKVLDFFSARKKKLIFFEETQNDIVSLQARDPNGFLISSGPMVQNGMAQGGIEFYGGKVGIDDDWRKAFEYGIVSLKEQFARMSQ